MVVQRTFDTKTFRNDILSVREVKKKIYRVVLNLIRQIHLLKNQLITGMYQKYLPGHFSKMPTLATTFQNLIVKLSFPFIRNPFQNSFNNRGPYALSYVTFI